MTIKIGDKVGYSHAWLQSTSMFTGPIPFAKGIVTELEEVTRDFVLAHVEWNHPDVPKKINVKNLAVVGTRAWRE